MRTRRRATIEDLRLTIDCLPRRTRIAMLQGMEANRIIAGAYTTQDGICPMLAAHRAGGRTSLIAFAKAWDRFAFRDSRSRSARRATERELLILRSHLEASLLAEDTPAGELVAVRIEHLALVARRSHDREREPDGDRKPQDAGRREPSPSSEDRRRQRHSRPGDPDRSRELRARPGWAWTRIVRGYDEYERVLMRLEAERAAAEPDPSEPARGAAEAEPSEPALRG